MTRLAVQVGAAAAMAMLLLAFGFITTEVDADAQQAENGRPRATPEPSAVDAGSAREPGPPRQQPKVKLGLVINDPRAFRGYTLLNPMNTQTTYLIDMEGRVVKTWKSEHSSMHAAHLLENGHLFRIAMLAGADRAFGGGPGSAGQIQEFAWDGELLWDFQFHNDKQLPHHDAAKMPNGHVLMVVWDKKTAGEAIAAGRKKELVSDYMLPDSIVEVKPTGKTTGELVWEWHLWDHLVQDHDATKANYGDVASHPELVDINFVEDLMGPGPGPPGPTAKAVRPPRDTASDAAKKAEAAKLKTLGYVGSPMQQTQHINPDWTHVNSVDFNAELDQVLLSTPAFSEIWIIDHSTTSAEAASHSGGRSGRGGDLLFRWGNPRAYRAGTNADQTLFAQHNAQWIPRGLPGEGHVLVFNNGGHRPDGSYSSVDELLLPLDGQGHYAHQPGAAFGPKKPVWSYTAAKRSDFYAFFISGAHRLENGNTMICSGPNGTLFEVTPEKEVVWKYVNPVQSGFGPPGFGPGGPPRTNEVLPWFLQDMLGLSPDQKKGIEALQKSVDESLSQGLTEAQKETLRKRSVPGPGGFAALPAPGQIMSIATQVMLKPTPEQRRRLSELQKEVDAKLGKVLTEAQQKRLERLQADFLRGGPPGGPAGGPPGGRGGPGGGPPGFPFGGPPGGGGVFRAYRYGPDFPGLAGRDLKPGKTVEELQPKEPQRRKDSQTAEKPVKA